KRDVLRDRAREEETFASPLTRHVGDAGSPGGRRLARRKRPAVDADAAALTPFGTDEEAEKLALACPGKTGKADDLAAFHGESHDLAAPAGHGGHLADQLGIGHRRPPLRIGAPGLPAGHPAD